MMFYMKNILNINLIKKDDLMYIIKIKADINHEMQPLATKQTLFYRMA